MVGNPTQASVPTASEQVQIFSRDGAESGSSKNGAATVNVSASPITWYTRRIRTAQNDCAVATERRIHRAMPGNSARL